MKKFFLVAALVGMALGFTQTIWGQTTPICIDNEINGDGSWQVCVEAGGETQTGNLDPIGPPATTDIIFDYFHYFDVGADGNALRLSTTSTTPPPVLSGQNQVTSTGQFLGTNQEMITWTAVSSIAPGSPVYQTVLTFSSVSPLGSLRVIQYLDEDIDNEDDDVLVVEGTPGASDFRLRTNDGPQNFGVSHAANYFSANNMTYLGWAAEIFPQLRSNITGSNSPFSRTGANNISPTTDSRFPGLNVFGPGDVTSAIAFDVDPTATSASVIFTLGGSPQISSADVSITKTASPEPVQGNTTLSYTLNVTNNGPNTATEVTVQDTLPNGVSLNATPSNCTSSTNSNTLTCALGTIGNNASASPMTINVTPPADCNGTPFSNTATVSANEVDRNPNNNTAQTSTNCVRQLQIAPLTGNITAGDSIAFSASGGVPPYTFRLVTNPSGGTISSPNATTAQYTSGLTTTLVTDMIEVSDSAGFTAVADVIVNPVVLPIVPNVVGLSEAAATAAITAVPGLSVGTITPAPNATVPAGQVFSQTPAAGPVPAGSAIALVVSSGPPVIAAVDVPNVVGQTQNAATAILTTANLILGAITAQPSPTVAPGVIISQDPVATTAVAPGSAVALVISSGNGIAVTNSDDAPDANPGDGVCDIGTGVCTLRAAIQEANATPGEQTITLTPGTYTLTRPGANEDGAATGDLDITDDLTIASSSGNATDVVIAANTLDRIFDLPLGSNPRVTLQGLMIQGGMVLSSTGGGLRNVGGNLIMEDSVVTGNQSNGSGGGISHLDGTLTLRNTQVSNNISQGLGGGLQAQGGNVTVDGNSQFRGNSANFGGGISVGRANVTVTSTLVENNMAVGIGGGIYKFLSPSDLLGGSPSFDVQLSNTTVQNNMPDNCEGNLNGC